MNRSNENGNLHRQNLEFWWKRVKVFFFLLNTNPFFLCLSLDDLVDQIEEHETTVRRWQFCQGVSGALAVRFRQHFRALHSVAAAQQLQRLFCISLFAKAARKQRAQLWMRLGCKQQRRRHDSRRQVRVLLLASSILTNRNRSASRDPTQDKEKKKNNLHFPEPESQECHQQSETPFQDFLRIH